MVLVGGRQQTPGMVEDGAHAAVLRGDIAHACFQYIQAVFQLGRQGSGFQVAYPGSRHFKSERHALYERADTHHVRQVFAP